MARTPTETGPAPPPGAGSEVPRRSWLLDTYLGVSRISAPAFRLSQAVRRRRGKEDAQRSGERWGRPGAARPDGMLVWLHGASVGECLVALRLIHALAEARKDIEFLLTSTTLTSARLVADRMPPRCRHQYLPHDTAAAMRRFLDHWRPDAAILIESEIWPRLVHEVHRRAVPLLLVNARMSERSARRWAMGPVRAMSGALLQRFTRVLAADERNLARLHALGLPQGRGVAAGSLKAGAEPPDCDAAALSSLRTQIAERALWLAASTHSGEEATVAQAHLAACAGTARPPLLVIAPRHPERGAQIAHELGQAGWRVVRRSIGEAITAQTEIYIADTLGEMGLWYRLAPFAFLGGSLTEIGGHNPYEPIALGTAVVHGPHTASFATIYNRLDRAGGALRVGDGDELSAAVTRLSAAPDEARMLAAAAEIVVAQEAGGLDTALEHILDVLERAPGD